MDSSELRSQSVVGQEVGARSEGVWRAEGGMRSCCLGFRRWKHHISRPSRHASPPASAGQNRRRGASVGQNRSSQIRRGLWWSSVEQDSGGVAFTDVSGSSIVPCDMRAPPPASRAGTSMYMNAVDIWLARLILDSYMGTCRLASR